MGVAADKDFVIATMGKLKSVAGFARASDSQQDHLLTVSLSNSAKTIWLWQRNYDVTRAVLS